jgi:hypothetical protein
MTPHFPCPNCAAPRSGPSEPCGKCRYPHQVRPTPPLRPAQKIQPFQFSLGTLLACVTISVVTFAFLEKRGIKGLNTALEVGGVFYPVINFFYQFWRNVTEHKPKRRSKQSPFASEGESSSGRE